VERWTIYCHTLIADGRRYVGLTKKTMMARWNDHVYKSKSAKGGRWHFPNAIRKYGKDAFSHEVLEVCYDLDVANLAEECWIELLDTRNPERGFNLAKGGKHAPHPIRRNPWDDPEYRAKCSENSKKLWDDPERRARMTNISPNFSPESREVLAAIRRGKTHNEETRAKIGAASKRLWQSPEYGNNTRQRDSESKQCPKHGSVPKSECYQRLHKNGRTYLMCKKCMADHNKRRFRARNGVRLLRPVT